MKLVLSGTEVADAITAHLALRGFKLLPDASGQRAVMIDTDTLEFTCLVEELPKPPPETLERAAVTMMSEYDNQQKAKP